MSSQARSASDPLATFLCPTDATFTLVMDGPNNGETIVNVIDVPVDTAVYSTIDFDPFEVLKEEFLN